MSDASILQIVHIDETGDSYYRMRWPGSVVAHQRPDWTVLSLDSQAKERYEWGLEADLLILFQSQDLDFLPIIKKRQQAGKKTIVEYNDNFYEPPMGSPTYYVWSDQNIHRSYELLMRTADHLIVTGPGLENLFQKKTTNPITILENDLPDKPLGLENLWSLGEEVHLGWAGSVGHLSDYIWCLPVIRKLMREFSNLHFHMMGNKVLPKYAFTPKDRTHYVPWGGMKEYFEFWKPLHLGIAPQLDTPYNNCRSDIKLVEMISRGVYPIVSDRLPYQKLIKKLNIPAFKVLSELEDRIREFIHHREEKKSELEAWYSYVFKERRAPDRLDRVALYEANLPKKRFGQVFGKTPGYHEIKGVPYPSSPSLNALHQAQKAKVEGRYEEALEYLKSGIAENPHHPELAYLELQILSRRGQVNFEERMKELMNENPEDLRPHLISLERDPTQVDTWKNVEAWLDQAPINVVTQLEKTIVPLLVRGLKREPKLREVAEVFIKIYAHSANFHFALARFYESQSLNQEAAKAYAWLLDKQALVDSLEFLKQFDRRELQSVYEGLTGN